MKNLDSIQSLLSRGEDEFGDLVAIIGHDGTTLSYSELNQQAEYVEIALRELGIVPGERVALLLPHGAELAVCLLGVASYAVCLPMDPAISDGELKTLLKESDAVALISCLTQRPAILEIASELEVAVIELNRSAQGSRGQFTLQCKHACKKSKNRQSHVLDHAVILLTSGTTSRPKLVPQTHQSLLTGAANLVAWFHLSSTDRGLNCMPLFHGNGLFVGFLPVLRSGGSLICMDSFNPAEFFRCFQRYDPTWFTTIPTFLQALLRETNPTGRSLGPHRLRFIRAGSAYLAPNIMTATEKLFGVPVIAGYGSAEAVHITNNPLPPLLRKASTVGLPCGQDVRIVDLQGSPLEAGIIGEIEVRGLSVTPGYLNDSSTNEEMFRAGWMRTGDEGYFDAEGYLTLVGRKKQMINRGGETISPFEIEAAILSHPSVIEAAVFPVPHPTLGENIAAAIVLGLDEEVSHHALKSYLSRRLSAQKIPYRFMELPRLAINKIGKVQYSELVELFLSASEGTPVQPVTLVQQILKRIWSEILGIEEIGVTDHFLDLGGDSISALNVLQAINHEFDLSLEVADVLFAQTIECLEAKILLALKEQGGQEAFGELIPDFTIEHKRDDHLSLAGLMPSQRDGLYRLLSEKKESTRNMQGISRYDRSRPLPLSFAEEGLWIINQLAPEDVTYNETLSIKIQGVLNRSILSESIRELVKRHENLRTTFPVVDVHPRREIAESLTIDLQIIDVCPSKDVSHTERLERFTSLVEQEVGQTFDLVTLPLFRTKLFDLGDHTYILVFIFHHIIMDGWSTGILLNELLEEYLVRVECRSPKRSDPPVQYVDYAAWQQQRWLNKEFQGSLDFWRQQLSGKTSQPMLPLSRSRSGLRSPKGAKAFRKSPPTLGPSVRKLSQQLGATLFVTLETAFKALLYLYSSSTDIVIGTSVANRVHSDLNNLIGCFVNTVVLRSDLSDNPSFKTLVEKECQTCYAVYAHQEFPFRHLVAEVNPPRIFGSTPLVQVMFALQDLPELSTSIPGLQIERLALHNGNAKFDLAVEVSILKTGQLLLMAEYCVELFESHTISQILEGYENILATVCKNPNVLLSGLTL